MHCSYWIKIAVIEIKVQYTKMQFSWRCLQIDDKVDVIYLFFLQTQKRERERGREGEERRGEERRERGELFVCFV
jgi:hypothetical protein